MTFWAGYFVVYDCPVSLGCLAVSLVSVPLKSCDNPEFLQSSNVSFRGQDCPQALHQEVLLEFNSNQGRFFFFFLSFPLQGERKHT